MYSFIVLPVLALYLYIAWRVSGALYRRTSGPVLRIVYPALAIVVFALAPFADIVYPRWRLQQLCATEAKTEILATTTLPPEYFNENGTLLYRNGNPLDLDWARLRTVLRIRGSEESFENSRIRKMKDVAFDQRTNVPLVSQTYFVYRGGWIGTTEQGIGNAKCTPTEPIELVIPKAIKRSNVL